MEQQNRGDIEINGIGSSNGGHFHNVIINGKGTITGDIQAECIEINGLGTILGKIQAKEIGITGNSSLKDCVQADELSIEGNTKIYGDVQATKLKVSGNATIQGNLKSEEIQIEGRTNISGNCESESFEAQGPVRIDGQLNAETIKLDLVWKCEIAEIGCQSIHVKYTEHSVWELIQSIFPTILITNMIEGDEIEIEHTHAKVVRGNHVFIGDNCEIDLVEYTGTFHKTMATKVKEYRKI